jgi:hypothetical protein
MLNELYELVLPMEEWMFQKYSDGFYIQDGAAHGGPNTRWEDVPAMFPTHKIHVGSQYVRH